MKYSQGSSLLSLLIGLTISMIVISALMSAFRSMVQVTVVSSQNADSDGQRASGLLRASKIMQAAAFGLTEPAFGSDVLVLSGAVLSGSSLSSATSQTGTPAVGNAMVWGFDTGSGYTCEGLYSSTSGPRSHGVQRPCSLIPVRWRLR